MLSLRLGDVDLDVRWAATAKGVVNGEYYEPVGVVGKRTPKSKDKKLAVELWTWTEEQLSGFLA